LNTALIFQYKNIIEDFKAKEILFGIKENSYKKIIDLHKPAWYNNFYTGAGVTTIVFVLFISLIH